MRGKAISQEVIEEVRDIWDSPTEYEELCDMP